MGKSTISTGPCSIAMLVHQRVYHGNVQSWILNFDAYVGSMFDGDFSSKKNPLVMTNIAMVKPWPIEIDGLPIQNGYD